MKEYFKGEKLNGCSYKIYRSRSKGDFWSQLYFGTSLSLAQAKELLELEHKAHPSDWLCLVEAKNTLVTSYVAKDAQ